MFRRLLVVLLLAVSLLAQERKSFAVPFHTVNGLILLKGQVNGKPAALLLDTGAVETMVSQRVAGFSGVKLLEMRVAQSSAGIEGEAVEWKVSLNVAGRMWRERPVLVVNLADTEKRLGTHLDGLLGADVLREFRQVRIDYKTHTLELEQ